MVVAGRLMSGCVVIAGDFGFPGAAVALRNAKSKFGAARWVAPFLWNEPTGRTGLQTAVRSRLARCWGVCQ
ncbi:hypothetical protein AL073_03105 [Loktanella sp. 1ANDIMAR09]|nr:hypothetical protein AL073_03105 [Loktanella sp. 1ANDIMAR09]